MKGDYSEIIATMNKMGITHPQRATLLALIAKRGMQQYRQGESALWAKLVKARDAKE